MKLFCLNVIHKKYFKGRKKLIKIVLIDNVFSFIIIHPSPLIIKRCIKVNKDEKQSGNMTRLCGGVVRRNL